MLIIPPIPVLSPVVDKPDLTLSKDFYIWLEQELRLRLQKTPPVLATVSLTGQVAAILTTALWSTVQAGVYRLSHYGRVQVPGTVSGSFTVTLTWTDGGVVQTKAYAVVNGNLTTSYGQGEDIFHADASTSIGYAVAYTTAGATPMEFRFDVSVEQVS